MAYTKVPPIKKVQTTEGPPSPTTPKKRFQISVIGKSTKTRIKKICPSPPRTIPISTR
jgi:hypothetical protein